MNLKLSFLLKIVLYILSINAKEITLKYVRKYTISDFLYLRSRGGPPATCRTSRRDSSRFLTFRSWLTFFTLLILRQRTWRRAGGNALAIGHTPRQRYQYIYHHPHSSSIIRPPTSSIDMRHSHAINICFDHSLLRSRIDTIFNLPPEFPYTFLKLPARLFLYLGIREFSSVNVVSTVWASALDYCILASFRIPSRSLTLENAFASILRRCRTTRS